MTPASLRRWWRQDDCVISLQLDETHAIFEREADGKRECILSVVLGGQEPDEVRSSVSHNLARIAGKDFRLLLCLRADKVLQRTVTLPLVVEENLHQALTFELDRLTPFKPEQVYFDYQIIERDSVRRHLTVALAVIRKSFLDHEMARVASFGVQVSGFRLADECSETQEQFNFLPAIARMRKSPDRLWVRVGLGLISSLLFAALLGIPIWQKRASAISLLAPLEKAKAAAMEVDQQRDRLRELVAERNLLPNKKWESPSALLVLDELTRLLKDDTFLAIFEFDGKVVQIQGESGAASGLVELLDASPMFKDVTFKAQLTKIQGSSADRFHISLALDSAAWPKPMRRELLAADDANDVVGAGLPPASSAVPATSDEKK